MHGASEDHILQGRNKESADQTAQSDQRLCGSHATKSDFLASPCGLSLTLKPVKLGHVGQSVRCLTADVCLTAVPGVESLIPAWSHTFVDIDHEMISTFILLAFPLLKKDCCQLQAKICAQSTG